MPIKRTKEERERLKGIIEYYLGCVEESAGTSPLYAKEEIYMNLLDFNEVFEGVCSMLKNEKKYLASACTFQKMSIIQTVFTFSK